MLDTPDRAIDPKRTVYPASEYEILEIPPEDLLVGGELRLYPEVVHRDFFRVRFQGQKLTFQPGPYVGVIPINDRIAIDVRPRVPIGNLARLLQLSRRKPVQLEKYLRDYGLQEEPSPSLIDSLAGALVNAVRPIEAKGRHYEYQRRVEHTSFPRGRILMGQTMQRFASRGITHRVMASQYERSPDTAPNRCLKYAIWYLAQRYIRMQRLGDRSGITKLLSGLNRAYHLFADVELDHSRQFLIHPLVVDPDYLPPNYGHYERALSIAAAIVEDKGVKLEGLGDNVQIASLLIKVDDVFEDYIRIVLQRELADLEPHLSILDGNLAGRMGGQKKLFDDADAPVANPDIVVRDNRSKDTDRRHPLLVEVKYKPLRGPPSREDLNQLIAYATSYRAPMAVLVQPTPVNTGQTLSCLGKIGSTAFYQCGFDLSERDLGLEEETFASRLRELVHMNSG
jgi:5-methylcytosine-specific restriction enzyme subunit McrC